MFRKRLVGRTTFDQKFFKTQTLIQARQQINLLTVIYLIRVFLWSGMGASRVPNIFFRS